jgi:hypothetical protein
MVYDMRRCVVEIETELVAVIESNGNENFAFWTHDVNGLADVQGFAICQVLDFDD